MIAITAMKENARNRVLANRGSHFVSSFAKNISRVVVESLYDIERRRSSIRFVLDLSSQPHKFHVVQSSCLKVAKNAVVDQRKNNLLTIRRETDICTACISQIVPSIPGLLSFYILYVSGTLRNLH